MTFSPNFNSSTLGTWKLSYRTGTADCWHPKLMSWLKKHTKTFSVFQSVMNGSPTTWEWSTSNIIIRTRVTNHKIINSLLVENIKIINIVQNYWLERLHKLKIAPQVKRVYKLPNPKFSKQKDGDWRLHCGFSRSNAFFVWICIFFYNVTGYRYSERTWKITGTHGH